ncbi:MAG: 2-isopropylmalate synthase [Clostridia bacterium]|nr:2-isopropylmalate synthase [Clostridia bacterium]
MDAKQKYRPFDSLPLGDRIWPSAQITAAPTWCSVDLRDGNQALVVPMNLEEKMVMFRLLTEIGFNEIEVGFPSANETEYRILRTLIEKDLIPDGVAVQVLVQSRLHLIEKTFDSLEGAKDVILHFYNSTSELQRRVVFKTDRKGIIDIALEGAKTIGERAQKAIDAGIRLRYEYSPESFSGTEPDFAVEICSKVMEAMGATPEHPMIVNLPSTVELSTPNCYADQIEYFRRNLPNRESALISIHPHNDRGTAVAASELALLAGAERVEGTLFGNGERTGNVDLVTLALNMYTQGVDPGLDLRQINRIRDTYERCTKMQVHERHPYAGDLVFTAFSGSHQDAISKGIEYRRKNSGTLWEIPYLPIDPADIGREYEPIIRINSQSGKGGAAFVLKTYFGFNLPKEMQPEFGAIVKEASDRCGDELSKEQVYTLFEQAYLSLSGPYSIKSHHIYEEPTEGEDNLVHFEGTIICGAEEKHAAGAGNGPISAFLNALDGIGMGGYDVVSYDEHAINRGSDARAIAYICLSDTAGHSTFGVGISSNINRASIKSIVSAINRLSAQA